MRRRHLIAELYWRNPPLALLGWLHVLLFLAALAAYATDERLVGGVNTWLKPMKFMASFALYLWTIAWFSKYIARPRVRLRVLSLVLATTILIETLCLLLQAMRGTQSHYNTGTDFDAAIFQCMGIMISIAMLVTLIMLFLLARPSVRLPPAYLWGIRFGILIFLTGAASGAMMIAKGSHTIGAVDGGAGLPLLNWSTVAGDLRIAHGMSIHGIQILPLVGYAISQWGATPRVSVKLGLVGFAAVLYLATVVILFRQALSGSPLF